jgi:hypothetical protein
LEHQREAVLGIILTVRQKRKEKPEQKKRSLEAFGRLGGSNRIFI